MRKKRLKEIADFAVTDDAPYETLEEAQEAMPTLTELIQTASDLLEAQRELEKLEKALDLMAGDLQRAEERETVLLCLNADLRLKLDAQASVLVEKK